MSLRHCAFGILLLVVLLIQTVSLRSGAFGGSILKGDAYGYYAWLPAVLIHGDPGFETLVEQQPAYGGGYQARAGLVYLEETGRYASKYTIGVALMELPFFVAAHVATGWLRNPQATGWEPMQWKPDGFNPLYDQAVALAGITYYFLGLILLWKLLRTWHAERTCLWVLAAITLGTSWLHYAAVEPGMSHGFSFFLFGAFLLRVLAWVRQPTLKNALWLGILTGMIALVRIPNLLIWLVVPFLLPGPVREWPRKYANHAFVVFALSAVFLLPQLLLWRYATGEWWQSGYAASKEGFYWTAPALASVWFSIRKGLFFFAPVLLLAVAGWRWKHPMRWASLTVFLVASYVVSCWHMWWFGGSYGHRAFIEYYVLLAFPLAAFLERSGRWVRRLGILVMIAACLWSLWWMKLYGTREYAIDGLDRAALFDVFYVRWQLIKAGIGL